MGPLDLEDPRLGCGHCKQPLEHLQVVVAGDRLRELSASTLVATGTEDIVIPASNSLALVNAIPGAWLAQFKGGGHAFMAQYPHPLADLINEFLAL